MKRRLAIPTSGFLQILESPIKIYRPLVPVGQRDFDRHAIPKLENQIIGIAHALFSLTFGLYSLGRLDIAFWLLQRPLTNAQKAVSVSPSIWSKTDVE